MLLRVPTNPSDPWSRSLAAQTGHRRPNVASSLERSKTAASEDPPWSQKNCRPTGIFLGGGVGSLDQGAGAEREQSGGARVIVREIPPTTKPTGA
jgi:hypothetical protein